MADALKQFDIFKFDVFEMHFKELNEDGLLISGEEGRHLMLLVRTQDEERETIDIVPAEDATEQFLLEPIQEEISI